jgi:hypothetical protein
MATGGRDEGIARNRGEPVGLVLRQGDRSLGSIAAPDAEANVSLGRPGPEVARDAKRLAPFDQRVRAEELDELHRCGAAH